ncbi:Ig-like domain-containing protein [Photobacterium angustum]|uniref:Ig-like domain-containing protein n=1 Tax=Photobacterium angustum TaxID=661 RepID=UPI000D15AEB6|nr:Ig-like domain-containing protein [Photobacterium angustum]PSV69537.1 hypothetical protein CTM95_00660 [Photobacterium angustum]
MKRILILTLSLFSLLLSGCNSGGGDGGDGKDGGGDQRWDFNASELQLSPAETVLPIGLTQPLKVDAIIDGEPNQDVTTTPALTWRSSDESAVTVDSTGHVKAIKTSEAPVVITATGMNADGSIVESTAQITVSSAVADAIQVTPNNGYNTLVVGFPVGYQATAMLSDGTTRDVTNDPALVWASSNDEIVTVASGIDSGNGIVSGLQAGSDLVTATLSANGVSSKGEATLRIVDAGSIKIDVLPVPADTTPDIIVGSTYDFVALLTVEDDVINITDSPAIRWSSTDASVATISTGVSAQHATATGVGTGSTDIFATATVGGASYDSNRVSLLVSEIVVTDLIVNAEFDSVPILLPQQLSAKAGSNDMTNTVIWSLESGQATLEGNVLTGTEAGEVVVKATSLSPDGHTRFEGSKTISVSADPISRIDVYPVSYTIPTGVNKAYTATAIVNGTDTYDVTNNVAINWTTSDTAVATVSKSGVATAAALLNGNKASTEIRATLALSDQLKPTGTAPLLVTSTAVSSLDISGQATIPLGMNFPLTATIRLADEHSSMNVTESVTWSSDNQYVTVTTGLESGNGVVTVLPNATPDETVIITAQLQNADGSQKIVGSHTITVAEAAVSSMSIAPKADQTTGSLTVGLTRQYEATLQLSNGQHKTLTENSDLHWSVVSGSDTFIKVSASGEVTALSAGTDKIQAIYSGLTETGKTISAESDDITAVEAVMVPGSLKIVRYSGKEDPGSDSIPLGLEVLYSAMATFTDSDTPKNVTGQTDWVVNPQGQSNVSLDTSHNGYVAVKALEITEKAVSLVATNSEYSESDTLSVDVGEKVITDYYIHTFTPVMQPNQQGGQVTAWGIFSNGDTIEITNDVQWSSDNPDAVTVSANTGELTVVGEWGQVATISGYYPALGATDIEKIEINIPTCGDVDDTSKDGARWKCLKVASDDKGNWFTNTPSYALMNSLGYAQSQSDDNTGDTYAHQFQEHGTTGPDDWFIQFVQTGKDVVNPGQGNDGQAGVNGQFDRWCQKLAAANFAGRNTWHRPSWELLTGFWAKYKGYSNGLWEARGWPTGRMYMTDKINGSTGTDYQMKSLFDGSEDLNQAPAKYSYGSCVATP